jgi:hypothetical protein
MKTKFFALATALLAVSATNAFAQSSASVSSSATVSVPITATATAPLAFGTITRGNTSTIAGNNASAGAFNFSGDESDQVTITVPGTVGLTTTNGGGGTMTANLDRANMRVNTTNSQGGSSVLDASSGSATTGLSADASGDGTNNDGMGQVYVWLGGSVTAAATQQRGSYTGTFTVSAAYSN